MKSNQKSPRPNFDVDSKKIVLLDEFIIQRPVYFMALKI